MWCNFDQSPIEDETISNAFSSQGIFKIRCEGQVEKYPNVQALLQNKRMVIAIDDCIILVNDELVAKYSFLSFNSHIDVMAISQSGNFIVCGLNNGEIHGIFIKGIPLFILNIHDEDANMMGKTFVSVQQVGNRFFVCCSNGSVYCSTDFDETSLGSTLTNPTSDDSLLDSVRLQRIRTGRLRGVTNSVMVSHCTGAPEEIETADLISVRGTLDSLYVGQSNDDDAKIKIPPKYGGVKKIFNLEHFILILTHSGHLLELCVHTKTVFLATPGFEPELEPEPIDDMIVVDCSNENLELLVLSKPVADEARIMKIIEYPSFKCSSEMELAQHTWLVEQPKCSLNLYYMRGMNENEKNMPTEVEVVLVSETQPSDRFKKLIAKGHLEEAEDFGKQFDLCLQPIYEAKAKRLLLKLASLNNHDQHALESAYSQLLELLKKIESKSFFKSIRMFNICSRKLTREFLQEILLHFDNEADEYDVMQIHEQIDRLETLAIIDPYECNMEWHKFVYNANLTKMLTKLFDTDIPTACLIWRRHASAIMPHLDVGELKKILSSILSNTEPFNVILWLRQFLPIVTNTHPGSLPVITDWIIERARSLQYSNHWPDIGLEFVTKVFEIFQDIKFLHSDVRRQYDRNMSKLRDLLHVLQDLSVLQKSYNLVFTLDNYLLESIEETAFSIMKRVHLEDLQGVVNDFLCPIFKEKGKSPVATIRRYISMLVANRYALSTWLERAVTCIELLHNEDDLLECALLVLQGAPVPWPNTIEPLLRLRNSTHPLATQISAEHEMQVIKMMKVKYGWPANGSSALSSLSLFVMRIVHMALPDMLDDIRILTKAAPEIATSANFTVCLQLVRKDKVEMAYQFYKILRSDKNTKHASEVVEFFAGTLENASFSVADDDTEEQGRLIEFFKLISADTSPCNRERLRRIQNRFTLMKRFGLEVSTISELIPLENRMRLLETGIELIFERSQTTANVTNYLMSEVSQLCEALSLSSVFGVCRVARRMRCLPLTCALCYATLELIECNQTNMDDFIELALEVIAQQILQAQSTKQSSFPVALHESDSLAFPLAHELLVCASLLKSNKLLALLDLIKYVKVASNGYALDAIENYYRDRDIEINELICQALNAAEIVVSDSTLNYQDSICSMAALEPKMNAKVTQKRNSISIFDEVDVKPHEKKQETFSSDQMSVVKFVARTLLLMVIETEPSNCLLRQLRQILGDDVGQNADNAREDFFLSLQLLINAKLHDVWYTMAMYLLQYQEHNSKILAKDFISKKLSRVFKNLMTHKDVNFIDLFGMLIADEHSSHLLETMEKDLRTDQQKINYLTLSEMYHTHMGHTDRAEIIRAKRIKQFYYMEFCKLNPSIKGKFNADIDKMDKLFKELHNQSIDLHLLKRMSQDFGLDYQQMLVSQILSILVAQEIEYEIKVDAFGAEQLVMMTTAQSIRDRVQPYICKVKNTELLTIKLKQLIGEINIYFYELYLCIIEILSFLDALPKEMQVWTRILHFLQHKMVTRRQNRPGQVETDAWLLSQPDVGVLPKIARYRLPFKPIVEQPIKDILENELTIQNCEGWFPLIEMHSVLNGSSDVASMRDYFCMTVVKNCIGGYKGKNDVETWNLKPSNNPFLKSILRLVKHVHNPSKAFMILYFVANYAPEGADQVEASYECYKFAIENESKITEPKYQEQLLKIKRKYPILKTQHLLYTYDLTDEHLMRLIESPTELICKLYNHDLILQSCKVDINAVVKEIAELHNLHLETIQLQLLKKWLSFTADKSETTGLEETFLEDNNMADEATNESSNAADNVARAYYILKSYPKKDAVQFLVAHICSPKSAINTSMQLQALECFSKINNMNDTKSYGMLDQGHYISIKCVHELKQLGYNFSLEKFNECNKIDILKTIWRNANNSATLILLANICLGFEIYLPKIWNGILKRMVALKMVDTLNALIDGLSCQPKLLHTEGLVEAWHCVLKTPFQNANHTRSINQEEELHKALFRLQSCPVLHKLNLLEFAEINVGLERIHIAAIIMALCKQEDLRLQIKNMINNSKCSKATRKEILDLEEAGILPVILNLALRELDI